MGFFLPDTVPIVKASRAKAAPAAMVRKQVLATTPGCENCQLRGSWPTLTSPKMSIVGPKDASILFIGGSPSLAADKSGHPFSKDQRAILDQVIPARERDLVAYQNAARCAALKDGERIPFPVLHSCSVHLADDVNSRPIKYIVGVGQEPLTYFWPGENIGDVHGVRIPVRIGDKTVWYYPVLGLDKIEEKGIRSPWGNILKSDIKRLFRDRKSWGKPFVADPKASDVILPTSEDEAQALVDKMRGSVGVDFETSKLKPYEIGGRLLTSAISDGDITIAFPVDHPEAQTDWGLRLTLDVMRNRQWVAHNSSMEICWALNKGRVPLDEMLHDFDDSQAIVRLLCERETVGALENAGRIAFGVNVKDITGVNSKRIMEYPLSVILPYNGLDAYGSAMIDRIMGDAARRDPNYIRMIESVSTTAIMELQGLPLDQPAADDLNTKWKDLTDKHEADAKRTFEARQFELTYGKPFRVSATEDVGKALVEFGRLQLPKLQKEGTYKTDDAALKVATNGEPHPLVDAVLAYRTSAKTKSTYIDPIREAPERYEDGMLHPSYTVMLTKTARLSSNDPNIQNFPKRKHREVRRPVIPIPKHLLVSIDWGQLEWRLAGMASKDKHLCQTILDDVDAHAYWRDYILEQYPDYWYRCADMSNADPNDKKAVLKGGRNIIKTDFVFASVFGSSVTSCSERTKIPLPIMQNIQGEFWHRFSGVKAWHKAQRREYDELGLVRTLTGRIRRGLLFGNEPINTPIQGTGADIVTEAMNAMRKLSFEYKEPCLMPRINVHDDLTFFLPDTNEAELMEYIYLICETLTEVRHAWQIVPLIVEVSVGENWAELEEVYVHKGSYAR